MTTQVLLGSYIGKYKMEELIGRGGMAEVYKAYQVNLDRHVAIKVMHKFLADDQDFLQRFEREARAMAASKHPNIVDVYDFDVDNDYYYIVMDYLSGGTLKNQIDRLTLEGGIIDLTRAIRIILEVSDGLAFAHKRGMIHRDIKPANIMFNDHGAAVLTDFGIARMVNRTSNTTTGSMIGTPAYMSPEQGLGEPGDHRSDIYSLGVLSYHLLTGQLPHEGDTPLSVVLKHINEVPVPPSRINTKLPGTIEKIILKALEKNPEHRYQTVQEMGRELRIAAKALKEITETGMIPSALLDIRQGKTKQVNGRELMDNSITIPGTEDVSLIDEYKEQPIQNNYNDPNPTQSSNLPAELKDVERDIVAVTTDDPQTNQSGAPNGLQLLPDEYSGYAPPPDSGNEVADRMTPSSQGMTADQLAAQTGNILDSLVGIDPAVQAINPETGSTTENNSSNEAYEPIEDVEYVKEIEGLYHDLDNNENEKALEEKAKKQRFSGFSGRKRTKEAQLEHSLRRQRRVNSLLTILFVILGIGLGIGLYSTFFEPNENGQSLVDQFNIWLNEVSGGTTAEGFDPSELVYDADVTNNGFTRDNINNHGYVMALTDRDSVPENWAVLLELERENGDWEVVPGSKATFNRDTEVAWPQAALNLSETETYRWRIYNRSNLNEVIATSGPFVPVNEATIQITEVSISGTQ